MSSLSASASAFVPASADADFELVSSPIAEPDRAAFSYPFSCISSGEEESWCESYDTDDFCKGLLGEEADDLSCGKFPDNIVEFYWLHEGHNDEDAWECLCKLDNGNYAYYTAWCDYPGFDCQGGMKMIVSKDLKRLFYEGLTERSRATCLKEKRTPPKPNTKTYRSDLARARDSEPFKWPVPVEFGGIYGHITPSQRVSKGPGQWQTYDVTLVGRHITVVCNGVTIISNQEIPGITGGAIDSNEGEPGPIMLQGDHTAVEYRNIVITPARK